MARTGRSSVLAGARALALVLALAALAAPGCGDDAGGPGGTDADATAGVDVTPDVAPDVAPDLTPDVTVADAAADAAADATADAREDTAGDAVSDTATDTTPDAGGDAGGPDTLRDAAVADVPDTVRDATADGLSDASADAGPADAAGETAAGDAPGDATVDGGGPLDGGADTSPDGAVDAGADAVGDTGPDAGEPPDRLLGQLNVEVLAADARFDWPELHAHAVFSPELAAAGLDDVAGWLALARGLPAYTPDGWWPLPALGDWARVDDLDPWQPTEEPTFLDAGLYVVVGEHLVAHVLELVLEDGGPPLYATPLEDGHEAALREDTSGALDLIVAGGADVGPAELAAAVSVPPPVVLTSHDPAFPLAIRPGVPLRFTWVPGGDPRDTIVIHGEGGWDLFVLHLPDDGAVTLADHIPDGALFVGEAPAFSIARVRREEVTLPDGRLVVATQSKQWLYGDIVGPYDVAPQHWPLGRTTAVTLTLNDWVLPAEGVTVETEPPLDVADVRVVDTTGHVLRADVTASWDTPTGPVAVTVRGPDGAVVARIPEAAWLGDTLFSAGDCQSAVDEGPVPDGTWFGTDIGLPAGQFDVDACVLADPAGREQAVPVHLEAGQTLTATLAGVDFVGTLYFARSCDDRQALPWCATWDGPRFPAQLRYTAFEAEDLLVVIDSSTRFEDPAAEYRLDLRRTPAQPFVLDLDTVSQGVEEEIGVISFAGDFDAADLSLDFGEGVAVLDAVVDAGDPGTVWATVEVDNETPPGRRDVTARIAGADRTVPDAFRVRAWSAPMPRCDLADTFTRLAPGAHEVMTWAGTLNTVDPGGCVPQADGWEAIYPVALGPSETLSVTVNGPGLDPVVYLQADCGGTVLACADNAGWDLPEVLSWTNGPEPRTVFLVIDGYTASDSGTYFIELEVGL